MIDIKPDKFTSLILLRTAMLTVLLISAFAPAAISSELVIIYSNDIRGETEPCG